MSVNLWIGGAIANPVVDFHRTQTTYDGNANFLSKIRDENRVLISINTFLLIPRKIWIFDYYFDFDLLIKFEYWFGHHGGSVAGPGEGLLQSHKYMIIKTNARILFFYIGIWWNSRHSNVLFTWIWLANQKAQQIRGRYVCSGLLVFLLNFATFKL